MKNNKKLRRISKKGWFGGVCAGFAYYFEVPVWAIRLIWTFFILPAPVWDFYFMRYFGYSCPI